MTHKNRRSALSANLRFRLLAAAALTTLLGGMPAQASDPNSLRIDQIGGGEFTLSAEQTGSGNVVGAAGLSISTMGDNTSRARTEGPANLQLMQNGTNNTVGLDLRNTPISGTTGGVTVNQNGSGNRARIRTGTAAAGSNSPTVIVNQAGTNGRADLNLDRGGISGTFRATTDSNGQVTLTTTGSVTDAEVSLKASNTEVTANLAGSNNNLSISRYGQGGTATAVTVDGNTNIVNLSAGIGGGATDFDNTLTVMGNTNSVGVSAGGANVTRRADYSSGISISGNNNTFDVLLDSNGGSTGTAALGASVTGDNNTFRLNAGRTGLNGTIGVTQRATVGNSNFAEIRSTGAGGLNLPNNSSINVTQDTVGGVSNTMSLQLSNPSSLSVSVTQRGQ